MRAGCESWGQMLLTGCPACRLRMRQGQEALWQLVTGNFLNWKILDAGRIQDGGHGLSKRKQGQCYLGGFKWHRVVLTWQFLEGSRHMRISRLAVWLWASEQMFWISDDAPL